MLHRSIFASAFVLMGGAMARIMRETGASTDARAYWIAGANFDETTEV